MQVVRRHSTIAVDMEGHNVGRSGQISLVQIASDAGIHIFDAVKLGAPLQVHMIFLFGSESIKKLMFDCRSACDAMRHLWNVNTFVNIRDLQLVEVLTRENERSRKPVLNTMRWCKKELLQADTATQDVLADEVESDGTAFWMTRPLDRHLLECAAEDVALLHSLEEKLLHRPSAPRVRMLLRASCDRFARLKADVRSADLLDSCYYTHNMLPMFITEVASDLHRPCRGCRRKVVDPLDKKMYCAVCWESRPITQTATGRTERFSHSPFATTLRKVRMCWNGDTCRRRLWGDCWFAHTQEEMRCEAFAKKGICPNEDHCTLKHTAHNATGEVTREYQQNINFKDVGDRPTFARVAHKIPLPSIASIVPKELLDGVASSSEEARKKKGWYGSDHLRKLYVAEKLGKGRGTLSRDNALGEEVTARRFFRDLLIVEATQNISDIRAYDIHNAVIRRGDPPNSSYFRIDCKGLAEKRPSVLRGDRVRVRDNTTMRWHMGYVYFINLDHLLVSFGGGFPSHGRTTFLVIFSMPETNWRKQFLALQEAPLLTANYINKHFADCSKRDMDMDQYYTSKRLLTMNPEQRECINRILHPPPLGKHHVVLLHGPPGTGKTTTLAAAIELMLGNGVVSPDRTQFKRPRILVATPSNEAANLLFERLAESGAVTSRTKHIRLLAESYDVQVCPKNVQWYTKRASELNLGDLLDVELIVSTLMVTGTLYTMGLDKGSFTHIAIDEAGQATETELLVPLQFMKGPFMEGEGTCVTFAGDHKQLGPVLRSMPSQILGFGISVLERLMQSCSSSSVQLLDSYRAHPSIMAVYNDLTYNNTLRAQANVEKRELLKGTSLFPYTLKTASANFHPMQFHHVEGREAREEDSPSWKNEAEAFKVVDLVERILLTEKLVFEDIVVLTPYLKQCQVIRDKLHFKFEEGRYPFIKPRDYKRKLMPVRVCSVESFQGREANVIILSCVRSQEASEVPNDHRQSIGFLRQPQRLNVAISRPIAGLFVVGNIGTLMSDPHWERLVEIFHCRFSALVDSKGSKIRDPAFRSIKERYASQTAEMKQHANTWAVVEVKDEEYTAMPPLDTDWNRAE